MLAICPKLAAGPYMINLFVANTDNAWFDFLSSERNLTEVNFWWPGETNFRALHPGEILAFRLKSPRNKIGGFGIFSDHSRLPIQMAWEAFGRGNGVSSLEGLRSAIAQLRTNVAVLPSTDIGSTVLVEPVFFPSDLWFDVPTSWSPSIQRGKLYSTENVEGLQLWKRLLATANLFTKINAPGFSEEQVRFGAPTLITPRLGQGAFRVAVTEAYGSAQLHRERFFQHWMPHT
jgi:putative restriction endonuclease